MSWQGTAHRWTASLGGRQQAAHLRYRPNDAHEYEFCQFKSVNLLPLHRHEPQVADFETKLTVNNDSVLSSKRNEGILNEAAVLIGQHMHATLEVLVIRRPWVDDTAFRLECKNVLDASQFGRFVGLTLYRVHPMAKGAECLALSSYEYLSGRGLFRRYLPCPALWCDLHLATTDRLKTHRAQHVCRKERTSDIAWIQHQPCYTKVLWASSRRKAVQCR